MTKKQVIFLFWKKKQLNFKLNNSLQEIFLNIEGNISEKMGVLS